MMPRVIAIVGPTGTGKTDLALAVAEAIGAEVVNCDSRQIYRGLDIGSAKPSLESRQRVPHHLFDVAAADEGFDCVRYRALALDAIAGIQQRGQVALLVGGTGLYLKALRFGLFPGPPRDDALRRELAAREAAAPGSLHRALAAVDAASAVRLHANDHTRLIRALEVQQLTGVPLSTWHAEHRFAGDELPLTVVGLHAARPRLYERIDRRCRTMLAAGLVDEVRGLLAAGYAADLPALQSIGYREIVAYLGGRLDFDAAIERMARASRRFAKRQMTWFRADPTIHWLDAETATAAAVITAATNAE